MELKLFYKYYGPILRPQNNESGEPEFNNVGEKSQDKNEPILHNTIINSRWNQITDIIQGFPLSSSTVRQCHWDEFQPSPYLGRDNITLPV